MSLKTRKRNIKNKKTKIRKNKKTKLRKNKKTKLYTKKKTRRRVKKRMKGGMLGMFKGKGRLSEVEKKEMETYITRNLPDEDFSVSIFFNPKLAGETNDNSLLYAYIKDRKIDNDMQKIYLLEAYEELVTQNSSSQKDNLTELFKEVVKAPLTNSDDNKAKYKKAILLYQHININLNTFSKEQFKIYKDLLSSYNEINSLKGDRQDGDMVTWLLKKIQTTGENLTKKIQAYFELNKARISITDFKTYLNQFKNT